MAPFPVEGGGIVLPPTRQPLDYDPAPSRNAFFTVMGVFAFFAVCFLVVAAWIRCVAGLEGFHSRYERRNRIDRTPRHADRKKRGISGFQEWNRHRSAFPSPSPPKRHAIDTKFWRDQNRPKSSFESEPLLRSPSLASSNNIYNTFGRGSRPIPRTPGHHRNWYSGEYSDSSSDDVRGGGIYQIPKTSARSRKIITAKASTLCGSPTRLSGSPSRRDQAKKIWMMPTLGSAGSKVSKSSRPSKSHRKGGSRSFGKISAQRKCTNVSTIGGGNWSANTIGRFEYDSRGLDVVFEEAGSTPER